ncbi:MAG: lantibiotic dehydratase, partial [Acidobacteriota bacterium]|nr:lantibiotic dehydratase [Acidobacteriota bacterium]
YRAVARQLEGLPAPVEMSRLFQVDMVKPSPEATLGGAVLEEIVRGVETLRRLGAPRGMDDLTRFREAFAARYEEREVSLVEALDDEAGIGFPPASAADAPGGPLLKGLAFPAAPEETTSWGPREKFLLRKLTEATGCGAREIVLEPRDIDEINRKDPPPLPGAFAVLVSVAAASEEALSSGDFRLLWSGTDGPSGGRLFGRFCDADDNLRRGVERHLRAEEALDPEAIFAEVVHLPEGRLGNVLFRPVLREYEIPYLGRSGASADRQIPITDLLVSVSGRHIALRSMSLNRRIVPRLTSAHNFRWLGLPLYRFLCELQGQEATGSLGWDWGPLWSAPFLPRVVCGRIVLSLAQWNVSKEELKRLAGSRGAERFRMVQSWRAKLGLPRLIVLADGDNRLPIDLANVLSVESFAHLIKDRDEAVLVEMFPGPDELCARGPEGRFLHELVVPFVRTSAGAASAHAAQPWISAPLARVPRSFPPGSEWVYAKLYGGASSADRVLREIVAPLVKKTFDCGAADRWFFIRYGDPDRHLRLRFHGEPARLLGEVVPALNAAAAPLLADGRLWKVQLDTYEREVERYGGPEGIELAERIFQADSEAALEILDMLEEGDEGADERWRLTLRGIHTLLEDFGFDLEGKRALLDGMRRGPAKELRSDESVKRGLGDRFRKESRSLEPLLDPERDAESPLAPGLAVLRGRSGRLAPLILELKAREQAGRLSQPHAALAPSYVHMHVNRLLRSAHRSQELVLYDFLARLYESRAIRTQRPH